MPPVQPMFPNGLKLIHKGFSVQKPDENSLEQPFTRTVAVEVPNTTKLVHVSVISLDMTFGSLANRTAGDIASVWFEISNHQESRLSEGIFEFDFKAVLQNKSNAMATGPWTGGFVFEFLCFG
ncbi:MAG: hypothetical protein V2B18_01820 [Pseudomonadota bacterium]